MKNYIKNFSQHQKINEQEESIDSKYKVADEQQVQIVKLTIQGPQDDITVFKNNSNGKWISGGYNENTERILYDLDETDFDEMTSSAGLEQDKEVDFFQDLFDVDTYWKAIQADDVLSRYKDLGLDTSVDHLN